VTRENKSKKSFGTSEI